TGVVDKSDNLIKLYINGVRIGIMEDNISSYGSVDTDDDLLIGTGGYDMVDGMIDEVHICSTARSTEWIATEYNNQFDPNGFYSIGSEEKLDITPPTYSNLMETSDPLELGDTEIITINVSDPSGIKQVNIEFESSNHTMNNIVGNTWQYSTWKPNIIGNYSYTIYMEDTHDNWNFTSDSIEVIDTTPPTYSNLIESADPLKFGQNETISIKVFDSPGTGVNQTIIEYESLNHSMIYAGGNTWTWSNWKPSEEKVYPYKIYMQDNANNWNMTSGEITVITTTAPLIENLTKSPETLELGDYITFFVDVDDNETNVSTVLIELENVNYTMNGPLGTTYNYTWTRSWVGTVLFKIYANDTADNWASFTNSFEIIDTTPPNFYALNESGDPLEFGNTERISINCTDLAGINQVLIEIEEYNRSMSNVGGDTWQYNLWTPPSTGNFSYTIWIEDNNNNWNSTNDSITVKDTISPFFNSLLESADPLELGYTVTISITVQDLAGINQVLIEFEEYNYSMSKFGVDTWRYSAWKSYEIGNYSYAIYMEDNNNNWNSTIGVITVKDTIFPIYSNLVESADPLELGSTLIITITVQDLAGINQTLIEFEGLNDSMSNIGGDNWRYICIPNKIGNYSYIIYMEDKSGNWNFASGLITVNDTIPPTYSDLTQSSPNPVELGTLLTIRIKVNDFAGINRTLIEFEGLNHSMSNIGGDTWEYGSWTPQNCTVYQYRIFMEDKSGNWNFTGGNFTIQDTTSPLPPIITRFPSGDISETITFDWLDGFDYSGISFYRLIIDNESDPFITPGFVFEINITNTGSESSYFELPESLMPGKYYYFLAQIDGVGLQSDFTTGTFTVVSSNNTPIFIIIGIIIASIVGSISLVIITRKRIKKSVIPQRKKIPIKGILHHINKISTSKSDSKADVLLKEEIGDISSINLEKEDLISGAELENNLMEFKALGEELFNEGAYLEAQKQFYRAKNMLLEAGRYEDAKLFSELIEGIEGLIDKRENLLKILERIKTEENVIKIFELYYDLIQISSKLRDLDAVKMYQAEFLQIFEKDEVKLIELIDYRLILEEQIKPLVIEKNFEIVTELYKKCEMISQVLVDLGREEEKFNVEKFKIKKKEYLGK
ncbi:MAG: hypothetical protein ACFE8N_01580, partial [Promethearchaeota archaeon]